LAVITTSFVGNTGSVSFACVGAEGATGSRFVP
jgi:hypothetical protein